VGPGSDEWGKVEVGFLEEMEGSKRDVGSS